MRILHLCESYFPSQGGVQEVMRQYSEGLAGLGHDVTVATGQPIGTIHSEVIHGVKVRRFDISGNEAFGIKGEIEAFRALLCSKSFDIIVGYAAQQWSVDLLIQWINETSAKKILFPCGFSGLFQPEYKVYFEKLKITLPRFDRLVFHSENYRDFQFCEGLGLRSKSLSLTNAASLIDFSDDLLARGLREKQKRKKQIILTVGSHTGGKGHHECIEIFNQAHLRNTDLVIVGNSAIEGCENYCRLASLKSRMSFKDRINSRKIHSVILNREATLELFAAADLFLFCSNVECSPLVLFEAAAAGLPFLTADVGNSREIANLTGGGIVLPTLRDARGQSKIDIVGSTKELKGLLGNSSARQKLAESGRSMVKSRLNWATTLARLESIYVDTVKRGESQCLAAL